MKKPMPLTFSAAIYLNVIFVNTTGETVNHDVTYHIIYSV
jgi:hypothetical protein